MTRAIAAIAVALMLVGAVAPPVHAGSLISFSSCGGMSSMDVIAFLKRLHGR